MESGGLMRPLEAQGGFRSMPGNPGLHPWRDVLLFASVALAIAGVVAVLGLGLHKASAGYETASGMDLGIAGAPGVLPEASQSRCSSEAQKRL
jgi:hypothetical protein